MASAAANDEALASFISVTGASRESAQFYLESARWDQSAAIEAFYEAGASCGFCA